MKELLYWTWCLPQTLLGFIVKTFLGAKKRELIKYEHNKRTVFTYYQSNANFGGVSLGKYIILGEGMNDEITIRHENGHQKQSLMLGWLYLIIIGLPSIVWCNFIYRSVKNKRTKQGKTTSYYWFYTEKWADKLAKIVRKPL